MIRWSVSIHRGGRLNITGDHVEITDSRILISTDPIPDPAIIQSLDDAVWSGLATSHGDGHPMVWQLSVSALTPFLAALDRRRPRSYGNQPSVCRAVQESGAPGNELLFIEAWKLD